MKVLITSRSFGKLSQEPGAILERAGLEIVRMQGDFSEAEFARVIPEFDALIIGAHPFPAELMKNCPKLRIIAKHGVGLDNIPLEAAKACGIAVTNTPGTNANAVADLSFGLMLNVARRIDASMNHVKRGDHRQDVGRDVCGKVLGLLGFGRVAQCVARRAVGFDMRVLAYDPYMKPPLDKEFAHVTLTDFDAVLCGCDYLSIHLPLTPETRGMIGRAEMLRMKRGAILINTARGGIVDERALQELILDGQIAGAGLDVTEQEPLSADNPLLKLDEVVITNHIGMYSVEAISAVSLLAAQSVSDVLSGREPKYRVV